MEGMNHHNMNGTNKYVLLKHLALQGPLSRVDLSNKTGLSKMAVTAIVNEYIAQGVIRQCGVASSTGGRKPTLLEIDPHALLTLGISISRDKVQVGIVNLRGEILESETVPFSSLTNSELFLNSVFYLCDLMTRHRLWERVWGIGVACAGPLSVQDGLVLNPPDFNNIHDVPIVDKLKERYGLPVYLQNDMGVAALAEMYFGTKANCSSFLYVGVGAGIGGGVIINHKLYCGASGLAGAIGHSIVEPGGLPCECGQHGCLEKYSSTRAVLKWARQESGNGQLSWLELTSALNNGDGLARRAFDRMSDYLIVALTNFQMAFDLECIIIGGDLYLAQDFVVDKVRAALQSDALAWRVRRRVRVESSSFAGNAYFIGTAALVMENNLICNSENPQ